MRIFKEKNDEVAFKQIVGEMINIEENLYMYDKGNIAEKKGDDYKTYPKIKKGNCTIVGKFNLGTIIVPDSVYMKGFIDSICALITRMEPPGSLMSPAPVERYINQFLSVMDVNSFKKTSDNTTDDCKRRLIQRNTFNDSEINWSIEHTRFTWSVISLSKYILASANINPLNNLSSIFWDRDDVIKLADNSFSLNLSIGTRFRFPKDMIELKTNDGTRIDNTMLISTYINSTQSVVWFNHILTQILTNNTNYANPNSKQCIGMTFANMKNTISILYQEWDDVLASYKFSDRSLKYDTFKQFYDNMVAKKEKDDKDKDNSEKDNSEKEKQKSKKNSEDYKKFKINTTYTSDNCHICDMLLYDDTYVCVDSSYFVYDDNNGNNTYGEPLLITKNNALLVCPICYHMSKYLNLSKDKRPYESRVVIRTVHPRTRKNIIDMIEDSKTKKIMKQFNDSYQGNRAVNAYSSKRKALNVPYDNDIHNYIFCKDTSAYLHDLASFENLSGKVEGDLHVHCEVKII